MVVRHLDVGRAEEGEGVVDRVRERGDPADVRAFAHALGADRMMRRGRDGEVGLPVRRLDRGRQEKSMSDAVVTLPVSS